MTSEITELKEIVSALQKEVVRLSDQEEIRKLQYKYGYYLDKCLYREVSDLFSEHPDTYAEFLGGRYNGKAGAQRLYVGRFAQRFVKGRNGPIKGFLLDHAQMQGIVDIDTDGTRGKGRFRTLMSAGVHKSIADIHPRGFVQWWEGGLYENEYIKENGVWKILKLKYFPFWHADFASGWSNTKPNHVPFETTMFPENQQGPDLLVEQTMLWPDTRVVPFHYPHPVTGKDVATDDLRAPVYGEDVSTSDPALSLL